MSVDEQDRKQPQESESAAQPEAGGPAPESGPEPVAPTSEDQETDASGEGGRESTPSPPQPPTGAPRSATFVMSGGEGEDDPPETESPVPVQSEDPLVGQLLRDKWKVLARLGAGSFGTVYKVQDTKGGWVDALKILSVDRVVGMDAEHARKRFLREAQLVKRLGQESPYVVGLSTYEEDLEAGLIYFLMDFVEGKNLADVVRAEGPFSPQRAVNLALQVCEALMVAHEGPEPVVHRDLKPENIMLTHGRGGEEIAKILDFGIAKIAEREADSRLTEAGTSLGTPGFAAPEQLRAGAVDGRTDLFAFGVILYTLLTGRDPWLGEPVGESSGKIYELMVASERGEVRPLGETGIEVPPALAEIVLKLLRRDPDERFASARELKSALQGLDLPETASAPGVAAAPSGMAFPRKPTPGVLAAGAVGVLVVLALLLSQPWGRTLERTELMARAEEGTVSRARVIPGGVEGRLRVLGVLPAPFQVSLTEQEIPQVVGTLRASGTEVDTSREVNRLLELAMEAQAQLRYFGQEGNDVRSYAQRMVALDPENAQARSLLLKVAERMAWDADAAFQEGSDGVAQALLRDCRAMLPGNPRCEGLTSGG